MRKLTIGVVLLAATLLGAVSSSGADVTAASGPKPRAASCFFTRDWQTWKPSPDARSILIRVGLKRYFRLILSSSCPSLKWPDARLITHFRGTDSVCDALDWDIKVSEGPPGGVIEPCIVKRMVELTPAEVAAIPKKQRP